MMRRCSLFVLVFLLCCSEEDDSGPRKIRYALLEVISGDHQTGATGADLPDEIVLKVKPAINKLLLDRFYVRAEETKGNGRIILDDPYGPLSPDGTGTFRTTWRLGCESNQSLTFYLFYADSCNINTQNPCVFADSVSVTATASTPKGWNRSCGVPAGIDRYNTKIKTYNNTMYATLARRFYQAKMGESLSWELVPGVPEGDIVNFGFTSTGKFYILTGDHGIYTSTNLQTWTSESTGILDPRYPQSLLVEDSVVYASFAVDGLYRLRPSKDNFWKKLLINGMYHEEYEFLTRHPNGKLYLFDKWGNYWESTDSGDNWRRVPLSYQYVNYQPEDLQIHPSGMIYIGSGDASLAILDPDTYTGELHKYYQWNSSSQFINNIVFRNSDEIYYLVNYTPDPGIYSSVNNWQKIQTGFDKQINQFVFDPSGHFLIGSWDGIYYWKD